MPALAAARGAHHPIALGSRLAVAINAIALVAFLLVYLLTLPTPERDITFRTTTSTVERMRGQSRSTAITPSSQYSYT
jgi:hypothetical protein